MMEPHHIGSEGQEMNRNAAANLALDDTQLGCQQGVDELSHGLLVYHGLVLAVVARIVDGAEALAMKLEERRQDWHDVQRHAIGSNRP
ncbi:hypothetical protein ASE63_10925 [Bosea sp. Root381]|nr:hypothetical protein ASE63_10925 [Bosea sp. Root381]